ncbi:DNA repair protein RecN [Periweissella cryptocerci]|uniref:DNA repair protein RecN n=1 Tax=Periweissella cryptocerci TaxID=2506420 RepID=A0A4P6YVK9_9LACO|nr:DNA repair protein RecN [Periweissella cryptocerci]QBO36757.1 DNA repair protein RecN [Periweissella cryptocerci]
MLRELSIDNFAIIPHLNVDFSTGMTVLSGETGAGKSIIIDAVGLLAGGRGSQEFIRTGSDKAILQAAFELNQENNLTLQMLDQLGIEHSDGQLILQREIQRSGRNVIRINGILANLATLKQVGETLVDIHGQNEHQELMQPEKHLGMLDEYATKQISALLSAYQAKYQAYQKVLAAVKKKQANEQEWAQRLDMLKFQVEELENAELVAGEEAELMAERDRLNNFQKIVEALEATNANLNGDEDQGALDSVGEAMNVMQSIENIDDQYREISEAIASAFYALQEAANDAVRQSDLLEYDEGRLNEIETRLEQLHQLERKYGDSVEVMMTYLDKIKQEYLEMQTANADGSELEQQLATLTADLQQAGQKLSQVRQTQGEKLAGAIHEQLKDLYMDKAVFSVYFKPTTNFFPTGIDDVEFYIQTNPGEDAKPLAKIASGGELSRMMLAMKTIFAQSQGITAIIFDEVDTGVSGRVAQAIAEKIADIASYSQVLTITHLPQVAAMADQHFFIEKKIIGKRTETSLTVLEDDQRAQEIARMLSGTEVTELALANAEELLKLARARKESHHA